jgi:HD-GYP domain-containing protein (c-di-GMP phosphodiesterase class II)
LKNLIILLACEEIGFQKTSKKNIQKNTLGQHDKLIYLLNMDELLKQIVENTLNNPQTRREEDGSIPLTEFWFERLKLMKDSERWDILKENSYEKRFQKFALIMQNKYTFKKEELFDTTYIFIK